MGDDPATHILAIEFEGYDGAGVYDALKFEVRIFKKSFKFWNEFVVLQIYLMIIKIFKI